MNTKTSFVSPDLPPGILENDTFTGNQLHDNKHDGVVILPWWALGETE